MNYTQNYHLPQWALNDRIMMDDFNNAMANLESGLNSNKAVQEQADATLSMQISEAKQIANAAKATAEATAYVTGTYTGNGDIYRSITVGFRPRYLLICSSQLTYQLSYRGLGMAMAGENVNSQRIYLTDSGFRLDMSNTANPYPSINESGMVYDYIAFR